MVVFFLHHFLVVVLSFSNLGEGQDECTESRCRHHHGPAIRFPFRHKGHQPNHCGYPGFDLYCNEKGQTVLELPSSVKLLVKNINYTSGEILLHDQHGCLPRQLQSLNLSASPFQFKGEPLADYTLFNCSPTNKYRKDSVPCLSALGYLVHAVESFNSITRSHILSCRKLYGFSSVPYEIFNKKFVLLYWSYPKCGACEEKSQRCRVKKNNSTNPETECIPKLDKGATSKWPQVTGGIFFLVLIFVIIPGGFSYLEKKEQKKKDMIEKFLEDFKALKSTRYSYADIKNITNQFKDKLG